MITFGDAANPDNIPYQYAALYDYTCTYPATREQAARWDKDHTRWITFAGDPEASVIDWEPGTRDYQTPALLTKWLDDRAHDHAGRWSWIYSDLSNAADASKCARGFAYMWWVSTLDGVARSKAELVNLLRDYGVTVEDCPIIYVAAQQVTTIDDRYDHNVCFAGW